MKKHSWLTRGLLFTSTGIAVMTYAIVSYSGDFGRGFGRSWPFECSFLIAAQLSSIDYT